MARSEDAILPFARIVHRSRYCASRRCPTCGASSPRRSCGLRRLRDLGSARPVVIEIRYSKHLCRRCGVYFNSPMSDLAEPGCHYTRRVRRMAVDKVLVDHLPLESVQEQMLREFHVHVPPSTLYEWVIEAGKKDRPSARSRPLDRAAL